MSELRQDPILSLLFLCIFFFYNLPHLSAKTLVSEYVGAGRCLTCHPEKYDQWKASGHARILHKSSDPEIKTIPLPDRKNISYAIGGYKWMILFLDRNGYLITSSSTGKGKNQYNLKSRKWVDYLPGERIPYDCGRCHTTGYSPEGHQDAFEGIVGTWKFNGVQCEACHGPGAVHVGSSSKRDIIIKKDVCLQCHGMEPLDLIPLNGVFLAQYTEANQLLKSNMKNLTCVDCHDPHVSSERSIKISCETCHRKVARMYKESYMYKVNVQCIDCHMPPAGIIAEGDPETFNGDFKSHLFRIDHRKGFPALEKNGQRINAGYLSVDYACMRCHSLYQKRQWAASFGMFAHRIKITTDIRIMRLQTVSTYIGFFSALISLLTALILKNWIGVSLKVNRKKFLTLHRLSSWITFSIYIFVSTLCIYFHFPLNNPLKVLDLGWFLIHPLNGLIMLAFYGGKIFTVRKLKKGWTSQGVFWGLGLFVAWLIQLTTIIFHV
ncbi:MAG: cytochrome c3 family protein [Nitrospirota bacterium]